MYSVDLINSSETVAAFRTYAADVYTLVGGGFGAKLAGEAASGTTTWLGYPAETGTLQAGQTSPRTFTVTVPAGTAAGDYISSVVIEDATPTATGTTGVSVRIAVAVAIRVPGALTPAFIGQSASETHRSGRSVVAVTIDNTGNALLKPAGTVRVTNARNTTVFTSSVVMDSFYAHTATTIEAEIPHVLPAGIYSVTLSLVDPTTETRMTETTHQFHVAAVLPVKAPPAASPAGLAVPWWWISLSAVAVLLIGFLVLWRFRDPRRVKQ